MFTGCLLDDLLVDGALHVVAPVFDPRPVPIRRVPDLAEVLHGLEVHDPDARVVDVGLDLPEHTEQFRREDLLLLALEELEHQRLIVHRVDHVVRVLKLRQEPAAPLRVHLVPVLLDELVQSPRVVCVDV